MMLKYSFCLFLFFVMPLIAMAQESGDQEQDPFRGDPIFNQSLRELMGEEPPAQAHADSSSGNASETPPRRRVRQLQREGLDFDGGLGSGPYHANPLYNQYPNLPMIHYNRVNGLFLGLKKSRMQRFRHLAGLGLSG